MHRVFFVGTSLASTIAITLSVANAERSLLYVAIGGQCIFALWTLLAWYRADSFQRSMEFIGRDVSKTLEHVGPEAVAILASMAERGRKQRSALVEILSELLYFKPDPMERYWIYVSLKTIGGWKAMCALRRAVRGAEPEELVRESVQRDCRDLTYSRILLRRFFEGGVGAREKS